MCRSLEWSHGRGGGRLSRLVRNHPGHLGADRPALPGPHREVDAGRIARVYVVPFIEDACVVVGFEHGDWGPAGGGLEPGESLRAALERELAEEAGGRLLTYTPFAVLCCHSRAAAPYRPHEPHPDYDCFYGYGEVELVSPPQLHDGVEHTVTVEVLPPDRAASFLAGKGRTWEAELYRLGPSSSATTSTDCRTLWIAAGANPKQVSVRAGHTPSASHWTATATAPCHDAELRDRLEAMHAAGLEGAVGGAVVELRAAAAAQRGAPRSKQRRPAGVADLTWADGGAPPETRTPKRCLKSANRSIPRPAARRRTRPPTRSFACRNYPRFPSFLSTTGQ
jgi:8-oxo-dGTP diphosphatase